MSLLGLVSRMARTRLQRPLQTFITKPVYTQPLSPFTPRYKSSIALAQDSTSSQASTTVETSTRKRDVPSYEMTCTCKVCQRRSTHKISKQGYSHGTVLVTCPGCKNRHLISDHLRIFSDTSITIEDILRKNGQLLKKGTLGADGNVEFWDDGSQSSRKSSPD